MIKTWTISLVVAWVIVLAGGYVLLRRASIPEPKLGGNNHRATEATGLREPFPELMMPGGDPKAAYANGREDAERDLANGNLIVMRYGYPAQWLDLHASNLWNRYRVELRSVAGCSVTECLIESVRGYNDVSKAEIERQYGAGVLDRAAREAAVEWERGRTNR